MIPDFYSSALNFYEASRFVPRIWWTSLADTTDKEAHERTDGNASVCPSVHSFVLLLDGVWHYIDSCASIRPNIHRILCVAFYVWHFRFFCHESTSRLCSCLTALWRFINFVLLLYFFLETENNFVFDSCNISTADRSLVSFQHSAAVANPDKFWKGRDIYQHRRHLSHMRKINYTRFIREKATYWKNCSGQ